jgi:hypothetical protein
VASGEATVDDGVRVGATVGVMVIATVGVSGADGVGGAGVNVGGRPVAVASGETACGGVGDGGSVVTVGVIVGVGNAEASTVIVGVATTSDATGTVVVAVNDATLSGSGEFIASGAATIGIVVVRACVAVGEG